MIFHPGRFVLLMVAACFSLAAQSADTYIGYSYSSGGGTLYAYATTDGSMSSGTCIHTYDVYAVLSGPPGTTEIGGGTGSTTAPTNTPVTITSNAQIASSLAGAYTFGSSGSAYCSCVENTFYTDPYNVQTLLTVGPPTINSNGVVIYPSIGGTVSSLEIGTTGVLAIYGTYLTGGGQDLGPVVRVSNGVTITGSVCE